MSDTNKLIEMLLDAGETGVFSGDIRSRGISGNPSQRMAEIEALGYATRSKWEPYPSGPRRRGKRYWITGHPSSEACPDVSSLPTGQLPAPVSAPFGLGQAQTSRPRGACAINDDWDWEAA